MVWVLWVELKVEFEVTYGFSWVLIPLLAALGFLLHSIGVRCDDPTVGWLFLDLHVHKILTMVCSGRVEPLIWLKM